MDDSCDVVKIYNKDDSATLTDHHSIVNGKKLDFTQCDKGSSAKWNIPYKYHLKNVSELESIKGQIGSGHLLI